uniref:Complex 1 LYR protein domain-containing protein n=1 Tax=Strigamia maritima TaxID=126957 RepID=T1JBK8_STRMM
MFVMANTNLVRRNVLSTYKKILRVSRTWIAKNEQDTEKERQYIINEVKTQFRRNKNLTDKNEIEKGLLEANARYTIAIHYKIPYPRPVNLPKGSFTKVKGIKLTDSPSRK